MLKFTNALLVPSFRRNIISYQRCVKEGFQFHFNFHGYESMTSPDGHSFKITTQNNLYFLNSLTANTVVSRTLDQWHRRLGHANKTDILKLPAVVNNMKIEKSADNKPCEVCIKAKFTQSISTNPDIRGSRSFESLHLWQSIRRAFTTS